MKRNITFRERMPFAQFSGKVSEMASDLSLEYKNETRFINNEPTVPRDLWVKSAIWATIKTSENESEMMFFAPVGRIGEGVRFGCCRKVAANDLENI